MNFKTFIIALVLSILAGFVYKGIKNFIKRYKLFKKKLRVLYESDNEITLEDLESTTKPLYKNIRLFQHFKLHDEEEDYYIFNEMFYEAANLVIMTIGISHNYLRERMSTEIGGLMDEMDDEMLEEFFPSIYCEDADIIERKNGQKLDYYIRCHVKPIKFEKDI